MQGESINPFLKFPFPKPNYLRFSCFKIIPFHPKLKILDKHINFQRNAEYSKNL